MSPASIEPVLLQPSSPSEESNSTSRFSSLRGVRWRIDLGILPSYSSSIDDLRRVAADSRRRYANLRRRIVIDPHISKDQSKPPNIVMDNPLSQNPDSIWGRFFRNAELERMLDQDLSRLYPEEGSYFQTVTCQSMLRRILLLWCLMHPEYGYKQGMHELLAPLLYVIQIDVQHLIKVQEQYEDIINDEFHQSSFPESDLLSSGRFKEPTKICIRSDKSIHPWENAKISSLDDLDPETRDKLLMIDPYGAEGELGVLVSEKFMEHDAYCMFDNLISGSQGVVAMAEFFSCTPSSGSITALPPVIEASIELYQLLSVVDSSLHIHLVELGVEPQYFALRWLRLLFGREFSLDDLLIIWDEIFSYPNYSSFSHKVSETELKRGILCSPRGAFISAMAVSMLVYLKSLLLATENATSCLQRLLNFPTDVNVKYLIEKAKSLQAVALDTILTSYSTQEATSRSMVANRRGHSSSFDSSDSYWEEKWRALNAVEELGGVNSGDLLPRKMIKGSLKEIFGLSRKKSKNEKEKIAGSSGKLAVQDNSAEEDQAKSKKELLNDSGIKESLPVGLDIEKDCLKEQEDQKVIGKSLYLAEKTCLNAENSFPTAVSPLRMANEHEYDSEESRIVSNSIMGNNYEVSIHDQKPCNNNIDKQASSIARNRTQQEIYETGKEASALEEQRPLSGKIHGLQKFASGSDEGNLHDLKTIDSQKPSEVGDSGKVKFGVLASEGYCACVGGTQTEVENESIITTSKSIGGSMLKNIQVIESILVQDQGQESSLDYTSNLNTGDEGRIAALTALNELRKIGNLLCEM